MAESDEWIKKLPSGLVVRYSYQLLTSGFSASAQVVEPQAAAMVYTHTHTHLAAPAGREQIEAEFAGELKNANAAAGA